MKISTSGPRAAWAGALLACGLALSAGAGTAAAAAVPAPPPISAHILGAGASTAIAGHYLVGLKDDTAVHARGIPASARTLAGKYGASVGRVWQDAVHGFSATMDAGRAAALAADPDVAWVQQDQTSQAADTQPAPALVDPNAIWAIDRDDQRRLPLDSTYDYLSQAGAGVHVYVVDTGIHATNTDFGGRVTLGPNLVTGEVPPQATSDDCAGHGTVVAGLAGGAKYGVAKKANLISVRVLDCGGHGQDADVVSGLNWAVGDVAAKKAANGGVWPAVINLSIEHICVDAANNPTACPAGTSQGIVTAEQGAVTAGIPVVTAAGNAITGKPALDACGNPIATAGGAIIVGSVQSGDSYSPTSNFGGCVNIWAPGVGVESDYFNPTNGNSNTATATATGTSFATPQVAGAAAILLSTPQFASATPAQIKAQLDANSTQNQITGMPDAASPNKLLYVPPTIEGSSVALAKTSTGALQAFGADASGNAFLTTQAAANATVWNTPIRSSSTGWFAFGADANADKRVQLIGLTPTDQVWQRQQIAVGSSLFTPWTAVGGLLQSVAVAHNQFGNLELLGVNQQGTAFFTSQTDVGAATYNAWQPFPGALPTFTSVAAETDALGLIEVFLVDTHGNLWHTAQTAPSTNSWTTPTQLTAPNNRLIGEVAVAQDGNHRLDLIGIDTQGIWQRVQTTPDTDTFSDWARVGPIPDTRHVAAETNANGTVQVLAVDHVGNIWQAAQSTTGSDTFNGWGSITGLFRP
jgi:subtilisin family serine protease